MSRFDIVLGFTVHIVWAGAGFTALFLAIPLGCELLKFACTPYLLWMTWRVTRLGVRSPFEPRALAAEGPHKPFTMGLLTSIPNQGGHLLSLGIASVLSLIHI